MLIIVLVIFIILCLSFCYMYYKILEIEKDLESLFDTCRDNTQIIHKIYKKVGYK